MKLILCVDDKGGLAFNHRRQSRDRVLNEHILMHCGMHRLWISPYTARLFERIRQYGFASLRIVSSGRKRTITASLRCTILHHT